MSGAFWTWQWDIEAVIALAALVLSIASWWYVLHISVRRILAKLKEYTVWPDVNDTRTVFMYVWLMNGSQYPIGIADIELRINGKSFSAEQQPGVPTLIRTPAGRVPIAVKSVRATQTPLTLGPYQTIDLFCAFNVPGDQATVDGTKAEMRFVTSRGTATRDLDFEPSRHSDKDIFLFDHDLVIERASEQRD